MQLIISGFRKLIRQLETVKPGYDDLSMQCFGMCI